MENGRRPRTGDSVMGALAQHRTPSQLPRRRPARRIRKRVLCCPQRPQSTSRNQIERISIKPRAVHVGTSACGNLTGNKTGSAAHFGESPGPVLVYKHRGVSISACWTDLVSDTHDARCATCYNWFVIKSFRHKGLRNLFETGSAAGVQPAHAKKLRMQLAALDSASVLDDMDIPGWRLHPLKGTEAPRWSITVNGNWRVTFEFQDGNCYVLD